MTQHDRSSNLNLIGLRSKRKQTNNFRFTSSCNEISSKNWERHKTSCIILWASNVFSSNRLSITWMLFGKNELSRFSYIHDWYSSSFVTWWVLLMLSGRAAYFFSAKCFCNCCCEGCLCLCICLSQNQLGSSVNLTFLYRNTEDHRTPFFRLRLSRRQSFPKLLFTKKWSIIWTCLGYIHKSPSESFVCRKKCENLQDLVFLRHSFFKLMQQRHQCFVISPTCSFVSGTFRVGAGTFFLCAPEREMWTRSKIFTLLG